MSYVTVEQRHIDMASEIASLDEQAPIQECCPVALALNEATGDEWLVSNYGCWITRKDTERSYLLAASVARWVKRYDKGEDVGPFRFRFDLWKLPRGIELS